jgi:inhibitor of KinA
MKIKYSHLGDGAIVIEVLGGISKETTAMVRSITARLECPSDALIKEVIPALTTVTIFYEVKENFQFREMKILLDSILAGLGRITPAEQRTIEIPVCYGGDYGPDLEFVAAHNQLKVEEVIKIHSGGTYEVQMIGFSPGFPFLGGMSEVIAAPRQSTPRLRIPARSVGIAGMQTGVYPIETPGGWQLIGRTPIELFLPEQEIPSLLQAGDRVIFKPITIIEYKNWEGGRHAQD